MGTRRHFINVIFTLTLLGVFALSSILVAVMGAQVYKHSADSMQSNYGTRTSLLYMSQKVRQSPDGGVKVGNLDGSDALILEETYGKDSYSSWIYADNGYLCEVTVPSGSPVNSGDGQRIMKLSSMKISDESGLLKITVVNAQGETDSLSVSRRTGS